MEISDQYEKTILIKLPMDNEQAELVFEVLNVDNELTGSGVTREIYIDEDCLVVIFNGVEYKKLRVSVNALLKNVKLILETKSLFS